jgi:hypothetical protein
MEKEKTTIKELENELKEKQEQLDAIFNWIAELYDIIEEWETDYNFILEELARIQNYCK